MRPTRARKPQHRIWMVAEDAGPYWVEAAGLSPEEAKELLARELELDPGLLKFVEGPKEITVCRRRVVVYEFDDDYAAHVAARQEALARARAARAAAETQRR